MGVRGEGGGQHLRDDGIVSPTMPELSVLMPVRDEAPTVGEAIAALRRQALADWELIIVDDRSTDGLAAAVEAAAAGDPRIRLAANRGEGQVAALNTAYPLAGGRFIKFADGDDVLSPLLSHHFAALAAAEAAYHDIRIVGPDLAPINVQRYGERFRSEPFALQLRPGIVHPSRSAWMLSRRVADRVFPLPAALVSPHEDYWIALAIKRYAASLAYVPQPLYLYRQHAGQIFGGIYNFAPDVVVRRARAMLGVLDVIAADAAGWLAGEPDAPRRIAAMRAYYGLLARERVRARDIATAPLAAGARAKLAVIKKLPRAAAALSRLKSGRAFAALRRAS